MSRITQSFVGVDLHKCTVTLTAVNAGREDRPAQDQHQEHRQDRRLARAAAAATAPGRGGLPVRGVVHRSLSRCVERIDIADATELANRRGKRRKTDRNDALDIARRLARGECPLGFIADRS